MVHLAAFRNLAGARSDRRPSLMPTCRAQAAARSAIVRDEDEGHAARLMQVEKQVDDCRPIEAVEIAGRFIGEDQGRLD